MKKAIYIFILLVTIISCEKDDICTSNNANTSHLIIRFYDIAATNTPKAVNSLLIQGFDNSFSYGIESTRDSIAIPLKILENNTSYKLIKDFDIDDNGTPDDDSDDIITGNEDVIVITYENEELFISKACGYKNIFNNVSFGLTGDGDNWVLNTTVVNNKIENEENAHIHIFH